MTPHDHDLPHAEPDEDLLFGPLDLHTVRDLVRCCAQLTGLCSERVEDLVLAVHEVAVCAFAIDPAPARLLITAGHDQLDCAIAEPGAHLYRAGPPQESRLADPGLGPGRGWHIAVALCDRMRLSPDGATLNLTMLLVPDSPGDLGCSRS